MASSPLCSWVLLFIVVVGWSWNRSDVCMAGKTYIVRMDKTQMPESYETHSQWYAAELDGVSVSDSAANRVLYSYDSAFHGFAAELESEELESLLKSDSVMGVYEDELYHLHTTRTPEFLGLDRDESLWDGHGGGASQGLDSASEEVVIGVLDTGVWPESKSFDDFGMGPVPSRWRGGCEAGPDFSPSLCNRKLIGARSFSRGYETALGGGSGGLPGKKPVEVVSARDRDGHGTHTASTAAGSRVANASLLGYASGTARGMATRSRVAAYKVCWSSGCFSSDILAGMDRAIDDGVDVLSLSLGGNAAPYYRDTISIGAFWAMQRGIFVSCSAGNSGPAAASLANTAPWITTVGAGTIDRDFPAYAALGNGRAAAGVSLYSGRGLGGRKFRLVYAAAAAIKRGFGNSAMAATNSSGLCMPGTLDPKLVRGKIVLCDRGVNARVEKGSVVAAAGGVGMVLANTAANGEELVADSHLLPAVAVGKLTGDMIRDYIRTSVNPTAMLSFRGTVVGIKPSPIVAAFSSRGPNIVTPEILKPDIIGPGVNILAGWSPSVGPSGLARDNRKSDFNIISGTSMSCPHISGVAALLKAAHPGWSPSAIRSALMTTAYTLDGFNSPLRDAATGSASNPLAYGSGHVDPQKALSPGLIYDITPEDYVEFLCLVNYTPTQFQILTKKTMTNCTRRFSNPGQLNYPSFSVVFSSGMETITYSRELTNVGSVNGAEYTVTVSSPPGVAVKVSPGRLVFKGVGSKLRYQVSFVARKGYNGEREFGWISWSDGQHVVRSPLAFAWNWRG